MVHKFGQSTPAKLFKVAFDLEREDESWPPYDVETLWIGKTDVKLQGRVENVPFYAKGVSFHDIIWVRPDHERRQLVFDRLEAQSGHSTVRIMVMTGDGRPAVERMLEAAGCDWEIADVRTLLAVDVPPAVDYAVLRRDLLALRADGLIGVEEGSISDVHRPLSEG